MTTVPSTGLQIRSLAKTNGELELSLAEFVVAKPADGEVRVRVEAAPINPSDQALLFSGADLNSLCATGSSTLRRSRTRVRPMPRSGPLPARQRALSQEPLSRSLAGSLIDERRPAPALSFGGAPPCSHSSMHSGTSRHGFPLVRVRGRRMEALAAAVSPRRFSGAERQAAVALWRD